jgi:hypothetical protein
MIFSRKVRELVTGDLAPGGKRCSVDPPAYRTMAMAEFRELTSDFIPHLGAFTSTRNHDHASIIDLSSSRA